jgi:hypothetical protein
MRYALIATAGLLAAGAAIFAVAQPTPPTTAVTPRPAQDKKLMPIDWQEVQETLRSKRLQRAALRQMSIAADAPQPSLPMLLPFDQKIAAAASVALFPREHSYAASMRMPQITIEVHGERRAMVLKEDDPLLRVMQSKNIARLAGADVPYAVDRTEGGYDLTFSRFGAAYLIAIECFNPETDERCTKPDFIRSLGENMGLVGKDSP